MFATLALASLVTAQVTPPRTPPGFSAAVVSEASALIGPGGLDVDATGRIVVQDAYGNGTSGDRFFAITPSGQTTVLAQMGTNSTCTVSEVAIDAAGNAYTYSTHNRMLVAAPNGALSSFVPSPIATGGGSCSNTSIIGLAYHPTDNLLYAASPQHQALYKIVGTTAQLVHGGLTSITGVDVHPSGDLVVWSASQQAFLRIDRQQVNVSTPIVPNPAVSVGSGVAVSPSGDIFATSGNKIVHVAPDGRSQTFACGFRGLVHLAFGPARSGGGTSLYVSQVGNGITGHDGDAIFEIAGAGFTSGAITGGCEDEDADGDGTPDRLDLHPCDPTAQGSAFAPAEGAFAQVMFEDQWPAQGDLDFNDVVVAYNHVHRTNLAGLTSSLRITYDVLALGGEYDNGLGLQLPVPKGSVASVTRKVGAGTPSPLALTNDALATVRVSDNLRELFGNQPDPINSIPSQGTLRGQTIELEIVFSAPVDLGGGLDPFDLFIFRSQDVTLEIHRPEYRGTMAMDPSRFGTQDDGTTATRAFVDFAGLPFALVLPEATAYPQEGTPISALFPQIVTFASSGGTQATDFYTSPALATAFSPAVTPALLGPANGADTSCVAAGNSVDNPAASCLVVLMSGGTQDGAYWIDPDGAGGLAPYQVYCDQTTDGGGWTVFQRRFDGSTNFYLTYASYQAGFGALASNHWLGNDKLAALTASAPMSLRVDLSRSNGQSYFAKFSSFAVADASTGYRLSVTGYSGTAGNSFTGHSGHRFSTYDRDQDTHSGSCAQAYRGGWWYGACHSSNLNGEWGSTSYARGPVWYALAGYYEPLVYTQMAVREQ